MRGLAPYWSRIPGVALACAVALLVAGVLLGLSTDRAHNAQAAREAQVEAEILAASVTAALAFDDDAAAQESVNALQVNPHVEAVGISDADGRRVAGFRRPGAELPSPDAARLRRLDGGRIQVSAPVVSGSQTLGQVTLRTTPEPLLRRLSQYGWTALFAAMAVLVVSVLAVAQAALTRANTELNARAEALTEANRELRIQIEERERAEEALRQSQKMEAVGRLTGGVAHDFNNLLMVASSGLDLMDRTTDPARRQKIKDSIHQAVLRGADLTRQLLAFSRRTALKPEVTALGDKIEEVRVLLERSLREDIRVEVVMPDGLWPVEIDQSELELALLNIAVNARDAMPIGGTLTIAAENVTSPGQADLGADFEGDFVRLSVTDTGLGMAPETVSRVFEPFFTTKEVGKGTGLGLSQVYGFARASGGDVRMESAPGKGSTVSLFLPRTAKAPSAAAPPPPRAQARPGGRILLVEDDDTVAGLVAEMLLALSWEPVRVANAAQALEVLDEHRRFDLVFSDMVMPGAMDGMDLAREIGRRRPDLPVLLTTGFSEAAAAAAREGLHLLRKPYGIEALSAELDAVRNERRAAE